MTDAERSFPPLLPVGDFVWSQWTRLMVGNASGTRFRTAAGHGDIFSERGSAAFGPFHIAHRGEFDKGLTEGQHISREPLSVTTEPVHGGTGFLKNESRCGSSVGEVRRTDLRIGIHVAPRRHGPDELANSLDGLRRRGFGKDPESLDREHCENSVVTHLPELLSTLRQRDSDFPDLIGGGIGFRKRGTQGRAGPVRIEQLNYSGMRCFGEVIFLTKKLR